MVVRLDSVANKMPGGWAQFESLVPNQTLCADTEIARVGFMTPQDVKSFVEKLRACGLEFLRDGEAIDIAVADQMRGLTSGCSWLEFGHQSMGDDGPRVAVCRLAGSEIMDLATPADWTFEESLSATFGFVPTEHLGKALKFVRREGNMDVYLNSLTGKEVFVGRTGG